MNYYSEIYFEMLEARLDLQIHNKYHELL